MNDKTFEDHIGLVTALPEEYTAMAAMVDNLQAYRSNRKGGGSQYFIGEIPSVHSGKHPVILTLAGMGTNLAAVRAQKMLDDYPGLHTIIMVGIAGGVPNPERPNEHVRLGDIVVSGPEGVVQYDFVKDIGWQIEHKHLPRPPSPMLLEAVRYLEAQSLKGECPWMDYITRAMNKLKGWKRPPNRTDQAIRHPTDPSRKKGWPKVFIGPIACANKLLKNPTERDRLRDEFKIKAVEMETSGIATAAWDSHAYYLAVRGICDYCDENKNDIWHNYAALVAAGYVAALIASVPVQLKSFKKSQPCITVSDNNELDFAKHQLVLNYMKDLEKRIKLDARPLIDLDNCTIPLTVKIDKENISAETILTTEKDSHLLIWGEAGSGKSVLLQKRAIQIAKHYTPQTKIPIYIRLCDYDGSNLLHFIIKHLRFGESSDLIIELLRRGEFEILLDGLDEVAIDKERLIVQLRNLYDLDKNRFIITGRPNNHVFLRGFRESKLQPIANRALFLFLSSRSNLANKKYDELYNIITDNARLTQFCDNPLLLSFVIRLYEQCRVNFETFSIENLSELYTKVVNLFFFREEEKGQCKSLAKKKFDLLSEIAFSMQALEGANKISKSKVDGIVDQALSGTDEYKFRVLREILQSNFLSFDPERCSFEFGLHKTFQEYFCARYIANRLNNCTLKPKELWLQYLSYKEDEKAWNVKGRALLPAWKNTLIFIAEMINKELILELFDLMTQNYKKTADVLADKYNPFLEDFGFALSFISGNRGHTFDSAQTFESCLSFDEAPWHIIKKVTPEIVRLLIEGITNKTKHILKRYNFFMYENVEIGNYRFSPVYHAVRNIKTRKQMNLLKQLLREGENINCHLLSIMEKVRTSQCIAILNEYILDKGNPERFVAAKALVEMGDKDIESILIGWLKNHADPEIYLAAEKLGEMRSKRAVPFLTEYISQPNNPDRDIFLKALCEIADKRSASALVEYIRDRTNPGLSTAITALGHMKVKKAVPYLIEHIQNIHNMYDISKKEEYGEIVKPVISALGHIGGQKAIEGLTYILVNCKDEYLKLEAARSLCHINKHNSKQAATVLRDLIWGSGNVDVRNEACLQLISAIGEDAIPDLIQYIREAYERFRKYSEKPLNKPKRPSRSIFGCKPPEHSKYLHGGQYVIMAIIGLLKDRSVELISEFLDSRGYARTVVPELLSLRSKLALSVLSEKAMNPIYPFAESLWDEIFDAASHNYFNFLSKFKHRKKPFFMIQSKFKYRRKNALHILKYIQAERLISAVLHFIDKRLRGHDERFNQSINFSGLLHTRSWNPLLPSISKFEEPRYRKKYIKEDLLNQLRSETFKNKLIDYVHCLKNNCRAAAAYILGRYNDLAAFECFMGYIQDSNNPYREKVILAMFDLEMKEAVPRLLDYLRDDSNIYREFAVYALGNLGTEVLIPYLLEYARVEKNPQNRQYAIEAVGKLGNRDAILSLRKFYRSAKTAGVTRDALKRIHERLKPRGYKAPNFD